MQKTAVTKLGMALKESIFPPSKGVLNPGTLEQGTKGLSQIF